MAALRLFNTLKAYNIKTRAVTGWHEFLLTTD
jgi:hypothetical protein